MACKCEPAGCSCDGDLSPARPGGQPQRDGYSLLTRMRPLERSSCFNSSAVTLPPPAAGADAGAAGRAPAATVAASAGAVRGRLVPCSAPDAPAAAAAAAPAAAMVAALAGGGVGDLRFLPAAAPSCIAARVRSEAAGGQ
jgi:hypothetical protein